MASLPVGEGWGSQARKEVPALLYSTATLLLGVVALLAKLKLKELVCRSSRRTSRLLYYSSRQKPRELPLLLSLQPSVGTKIEPFSFSPQFLPPGAPPKVL